MVRIAPNQAPPTQAEIDRVKHIITEIIRCAGGSIEGKLRLFKVFYFAHLIYARNSAGYLSEWPIVRMPMGPGIGDADLILGQMQRERTIEVREKPKGPYMTFEYRTTVQEIPELSLDAIDAIRSAVEFTKGKTAAELSEITHQHSHSWKDGRDGDTLNIYVDLLPEERYEEAKRRTKSVVSSLRDAGQL